MSAPDLVWLSGETLCEMVDPLANITAVETALRTSASSEVVTPDRIHVSAASSTLLIMPAAKPKAYGIKLVTVAPRNAARGKPVTQGVMALFDAETGAPRYLIDAAILTAQRTGAVAALGLRLLGCGPESRIGLIGCGVQGAWTLLHAHALFGTQRFACLPRSAAGFERFRRIVHRIAPQISFDVHQDSGALVSTSDLIVTATGSETSVLPDDPVALAGKAVVALGSYRPAMRELPDALFAGYGTVLVDSSHASRESGDLLVPLRQGLLREENILPVGTLLAANRLADPRCRLFKSVGYAPCDLALAEALTDRAKTIGKGQRFAP